jgi:hypothetical protein
VLERLGDAEITEFGDIPRSEEDVLRLQITMNDLPVVEVLELKADLHKAIEDDVLPLRL